MKSSKFSKPDACRWRVCLALAAGLIMFRELENWQYFIETILFIVGSILCDLAQRKYKDEFYLEAMGKRNL